MRRFFRVLVAGFIVIVALNAIGFLVNPGLTYIDLAEYYAVDHIATSEFRVGTNRVDRPPSVEYHYRSGADDEVMVWFSGGRADVDVFSHRSCSLFVGLGFPVIPVFFLPSEWVFEDLVLRFLVFGAEPPSVEPERIWIETASGDVVTPAPNLPTAVCPDRGEVVFDESRESTLWGWMLCYPIKPADLKSFTLHVEGVTLSDGRRLRMPVVRFRKRSSVVISTGSPV